MSKNKLKVYFGIFSTLVYLLCVASYFYLRRELVPELINPTAQINTISIFIIAAFVITGIYHIVLLINSLGNLKGDLLNSIYISAVIISGITLLSDAVLLSDIGKEYIQFDVANQWNMLLVFSLFHLVVMIIGSMVLVNNKTDEKLFARFKDNEKLFTTIHHIGLITGMVGLASIIIIRMGGIVPDKYSELLMIPVSGIVTAPLVLFVVFWGIKLMGKRISEWLDEMQIKNIGTAAIITLILSAPVYILAVVSQMFAFWHFGLLFCVLFQIFFMLTVYSLAVILKK